jgi:hypothetical protein
MNKFFPQVFKMAAIFKMAEKLVNQTKEQHKGRPTQVKRPTPATNAKHQDSLTDEAFKNTNNEHEEEEGSTKKIKTQKGNKNNEM